MYARRCTMSLLGQWLRLAMLALLSLWATAGWAQLALDWAVGQSGGLCYPKNMVVDADGNSYTVGLTNGNTDFDPGPGVYNVPNVVTYDVPFLCKLDSLGQLVWTKHFAVSIGGSATMEDVDVDRAGNVYVAGT